MADRSSKKRPLDVKAMAAQIVEEAIGESAPDDSGKNPASGRLAAARRKEGQEGQGGEADL